MFVTYHCGYENNLQLDNGAAQFWIFNYILLIIFFPLIKVLLYHYACWLTGLL